MTDAAGEGATRTGQESEAGGLAPESAESKEYYYLQDIVAKFNDHCFETKKWSVALTSAAAIFSGFTAGSAAVSALIIFVLALAFWTTEAVWRANQFAFIRRVRELESRVGEQGSPLISHRWRRYANGAAAAAESSNWSSAEGETTWSGIRGHFADRRTALPHIVIAAVALIGLAFTVPGALRGAAEDDEPVARLEISVADNGVVTVERAD